MAQNSITWYYIEFTTVVLQQHLKHMHTYIYSVFQNIIYLILKCGYLFLKLNFHLSSALIIALPQKSENW